MAAKYPANRLVPYNAIVKFNPITQILLLFHNAGKAGVLPPLIIVLIIFLLIGRGFCGWICPVGAGLDIFNRIFGRWIRRPGRDVRTPTLRIKYRFLIGGIILLFAGVSLYWLIDPTSMFTRNTALIVYPAIDGISRAITKPLSSLPNVGYPIEKATRALFNPLPVRSVYLLLFFLILALIFAFEIFARRFFCKAICPLGALLGWFSNISPFRMTVEKASCTRCQACVKVCKTHAMELKDDLKISPLECILCFACREKCPTTVLNVKLKKPGFRRNPVEFQSTRRDFIIGIIGAAVLFPIFKFGDTRIRRPKYLIRPPGALPEERFSQVCAKCGSCMKMCYTSGLQPVLFEHGVNNLFTPRMVNSIGYCGYECNACGKICPTGAITFMPLKTKRKAFMGTAEIDHQTCLPWAEKKPCITCEEMCPIPQKAIELEERPVVYDDGTKDIIKLPHVVKENCIGCGICEFNCPVRPIRSIRVVYDGETRGGEIRETPPRERRTNFHTNEKTYWK